MSLDNPDQQVQPILTPRQKASKDWYERNQARLKEERKLATLAKQPEPLFLDGKPAKACTRCEAVFIIEEFVNPRARGGFRSYCVSCHLASKRKHYEENKEEILVKQREYVVRTDANQSPSKKAYRVANSEKQKAYMKDYYVEHGQAENERRKALYAVDEEYRRAKLDQALLWAKNNPDKANARKQRRRAKLQEAPGSYTAQEWQDLKAKYDYRCLCCGKQEPEIKLSVDHVIPITCGGSNSIDNIQPLCRSDNSKKHTQTIDYRPAELIAA